MKRKIISLLLAASLTASIGFADEKSLNINDENKDIPEELQDTDKHDETPPYFLDQFIPQYQGEGEIHEIAVRSDGIKTFEYQLNGRKYEFYMFKANMNDKANYVDLKIADNKIGHLNYLPRLVKQAEEEDKNSEVLAAINGGLFNMGAGRQPITSVIEDGNIKYIYQKGALAHFNGDNEMTLSRDDFEVFFAVNNCWEDPYGFSAIFVNQVNYDPNGVGLLTSDYDGEKFKKAMTVVEVKDKTAIQIHTNIPNYIEKGNLLIVTENNKAVKNIQIGDRIDYVFRAHDRSNPTVRYPIFSHRTGIGSGPVIIENGKLAIDPTRDHLNDLGIYNNRPRSMVGMTKDKHLYFVVAKNIDITSFGKLGLRMGMETALNLDGGGSTGLMIGGQHAYVQSPQRAIANALLIKRQKVQAIRILINDRERFYDSDPYIYQGRTMVPLRGILEDLECKVSWDAENEKVMFERYGKTFSVKKGSNIIYGEDKNFEMDVPLLIKDGRSAVSARFLSEVLGGEVTWNNNKRLVDIKIASANELFRVGKDSFLTGDMEKAKNYYEKALSADPNNISSMNGLANIREQRNDLEGASKAYLKILEIKNNYIPALASMGKIYQDKEDHRNAIDMFSRLIKEDGSNFEGIVGLAKSYGKIKDNKNSIFYYEKAYEIEPKPFVAFSLINLYESELEKDAKNLDLLKKTGKMYENVQQISDAIAYYEKAYNVKSDDIFVLKSLGGIYSASNKKLAMKYYEEAYKIDNKDLDLIKSLAFMYEEEGDLKKAISYYNDAYALNSKDQDLLVKLANLYEADMQYQNAADFYEKYLALNDKNVDVAKKIGDLYRSQGKNEQALSFYKKAHQLNLDENMLVKILELSIEIKDFEGGIACYEPLQNKQFSNGKIYYLMADIYLKKQLKEEAVDFNEIGHLPKEKCTNEKVYNNYKYYLNSTSSNSEDPIEFKENARQYIQKYEEGSKAENSQGEK